VREMTQETFTKEKFWAELDDLGEEEVRDRIVTGRYGAGNKKLQLAREWLRRRETERIEASNREQIRIARSAKNAAWAAAMAAIIAAVCAVITFLI